jgi:hypothetical protein
MKYAFASPGWMGFMHGMMIERALRYAKEAPDLRWSICEVFTDPPKSLSPDGAPLAWSAVIEGGEVRFSANASRSAAFKVIIDYDDVLPLARYDTRGDPQRAAELRAMSQALIDQGRMTLIGDRALRDPRIGDFHDVIARVTE